MTLVKLASVLWLSILTAVIIYKLTRITDIHFWKGVLWGLFMVFIGLITAAAIIGVKA